MSSDRPPQTRDPADLGINACSQYNSMYPSTTLDRTHHGSDDSHSVRQHVLIIKTNTRVSISQNDLILDLTSKRN